MFVLQLGIQTISMFKNYNTNGIDVVNYYLFEMYLQIHAKLLFKIPIVMNASSNDRVN